MYQRRIEFFKTVGGGGGLNSHKIFDEIISLDNLFLAWKEFKKGKKNRSDVQKFEFNLEDNLFQLHRELRTKTYQHSNYTSFYVKDPKLRNINKANIRDRVLHHAVFRILYSIFDKSFIFDSYSCRLSKGTHRAVLRMETFCRKLSRNNIKNIFALKCDVRKFFDSVGQDILLELIKKKIHDENATWLIKGIVKSFNKGIPLGNITSQLFANIYLNELDQFIKHKLKIKYYIRYCDDFVILSEDIKYLIKLADIINGFLNNKLRLSLRDDKIIIRKWGQGIDFLGYVSLPRHRVLRTRTKKRILRKLEVRKRELEGGMISEESFNQSLQSYLGILKHCKGNKIKEDFLS